ncbi:MAG: hypothetical protein QM790_20445 [Nibricoccus sp.]
MKLACVFPWFIRGMLAAVFITAWAARAGATGFTSDLSDENKVGIGVAKLTPEQIAALDAQVAREIAVARQGDTPAFSTTFSKRRTPQQRKEAGLDRLMTPELNRLDTLVANAVANRPAPPGPTIVKPASTTPESASDWVDVTPPKWDVHGQVSLAYIWGSGGRSGYGASVATTATDPSGKVSVSLVLSQFTFKGKGSRYLYDYPCDQGW